MIRQSRRVIRETTLSPEMLEELAIQTAITFGNAQLGGEMYVGLYQVSPRSHLSDLAFAGTVQELGRGFARIQGCSLYAPHGILMADDVSPVEVEVSCNERGVSVREDGCEYSGFLYSNMEKFCVGLRELGYNLPSFFGESVRKALVDLKKAD